MTVIGKIRKFVLSCFISGMGYEKTVTKRDKVGNVIKVRKGYTNPDRKQVSETWFENGMLHGSAKQYKLKSDGKQLELEIIYKNNVHIEASDFHDNGCLKKINQYKQVPDNEYLEDDGWRAQFDETGKTEYCFRVEDGITYNRDDIKSVSSFLALKNEIGMGHSGNIRDINGISVGKKGIPLSFEYSLS